MITKLKNKEIAIGWDVGGWSGKNHGFCILESQGDEIKLLKAETLNVFQIKKNLEQILEQYQKTHDIVLGVDAPLQFPELFRQIINQNPIDIFSLVQSRQKENPIAWRGTDLYIKKYFAKTPLSASFSFLTSNATVAIALIGELKSKNKTLCVLPFDEETSIKAIEVYPGLLKSQVLKNSPLFSEYRKILEGKSFKKIEGFHYYFQDTKDKTDLADAVICAFYGLGFLGNSNWVPKIKKQIPDEMLAIAKREGWIYHPDIF
jgi:hypothetical protein